MNKQVFLWIAGILTGIAWSLINFWFTKNLLENVISKKSNLKIILHLLVKFPLLYLVGFWVLASKIFPVFSLLIGLTLALVLIGVINVSRNKYHAA